MPRPKPGSMPKRKAKAIKKAAPKGAKSVHTVGPNGRSYQTNLKSKKGWQKDLNEDRRYKNQAASKKRKRTTAKAPSLSSIKSTAGAVKYLKAKGYTVSKRKKK